MLFSDIIQKKRDGQALDDAEIALFVKGLADGSLPIEQVAAMAMAIYFRDMNFAETGALTKAMAASGTVIDWRRERLGGPIIDKHSTGGIGDNVSLLLAPIVAACGGFVPMISGRGLAHTGGTLDKMGSIPGYNVTPDLDRFKTVVKSVGCAIIGQTGQLAPADGRLYAIRSVTATVESFPLINGSILSKKLAAGLEGLVMDIKTGSGAFMQTRAEAQALARSLIGTGAHCGLPIHALVTDMSETLGRHAGNSVEVTEAVAYLRCDDRESRLDTVTLALASEMLLIGDLAKTREAAHAKAEAALTSGRAAEVFAKMVTALGGPADLMDKPEQYLPQAPIVRPIFPKTDGYIVAVDGRAVGNAIIALGGGRLSAEDTIDPSVGFTDFLTIGSRVGRTTPIAFVHAADETAAHRATAELLAAYTIAEEAPPPTQVIYDLITEA